MYMCDLVVESTYTNSFGTAFDVGDSWISRVLYDSLTCLRCMTRGVIQKIETERASGNEDRSYVSLDGN